MNLFGLHFRRLSTILATFPGVCSVIRGGETGRHISENRDQKKSRVAQRRLGSWSAVVRRRHLVHGRQWHPFKRLASRSHRGGSASPQGRQQDFPKGRMPGGRTQAIVCSRLTSDSGLMWLACAAAEGSPSMPRGLGSGGRRRHLVFDSEKHGNTSFNTSPKEALPQARIGAMIEEDPVSKSQTGPRIVT